MERARSDVRRRDPQETRSTHAGLRWRAVDQEGEVLESFVTKDRDMAAALKFIKKTLKRHGRTEAIVTDGLAFYVLRGGAEADRRRAVMA